MSSLLRKKAAVTEITLIGDNDIEDVLTEVLQSPEESIMPMDRLIAQEYYDAEIDAEEARSRICFIFYYTGLIGLKLYAEDRAGWGSRVARHN
jgi:hypothetical protein